MSSFEGHKPNSQHLFALCGFSLTIEWLLYYDKSKPHKFLHSSAMLVINYSFTILRFYDNVACGLLPQKLVMYNFFF